MIDFELELLNQNEDWRLVLEAYHTQLIEAAEQEAEHDGWAVRLVDVDGIKAEHMPRIHGKLIALGLLKFQLSGRTSGVRYQLSYEGKRTLQRTQGSDDELDSDSDDADSESGDLAQSA